MKKRIVFPIIFILLCTNLILGIRLERLSAADEDEKDEAYKNIELFTSVMEIIRKDYVDGANLTYQDLVYSALKGMLNGLDPHSQFMEPNAYKEMKEETEGQFGGIGVVIGMKDSIITVISPIEDTPGFKAGLLPGDKIIRIEGKSTDKVSLTDAVKQLRGAPGTKVTLTLVRSKSNEVKEFTITRAIIKVESVKGAELINEKIGYVRITEFKERTAQEFEDALDKLEKQGMEGLVIDLRGDPGGLLESAVDVAGKFLAKGDLVVSTEGRNPSVKNLYRVRNNDQHPAYPIAILINAGSASGSEIVAGALQDTKRAVIVGETSFGKGSVQSVMPLRDGSAIRLTTAKYYTPSRKPIHEHGIVPDIVVPMSEEDWAQILRQRSQGKFGEDEEKDTDKPEKANDKKEQPIRDVQLDRAVDLLKGVSVFMKHGSEHASLFSK
jgi:carboxyl-terminal processing protease